MKYWIFVVDDNTWPEHLKAGVAAINKPPTVRQQQSAIAELIGVRPGDLILFNLRVSEAHPPRILGLYEATTKPYYDSGPIFPGAEFVGVAPRYLNPYRVGFKQVVNFPRPLDMDQIWLLRDRGLIWSIQQSRGDAIGVHACTSITAPEGETILRMLEAANPVKGPPVSVPPPPPARTPLPVELRTDPGGNLHYEGALKALLVDGLADGRFKDILGDYDDFVPNFLTPARYEIDVLLLKYDGGSITRYGILELKAEKFTEADLGRLLDYESWFVRTRAISPIQVHPIALAYDHEPILEHVSQRRKYSGRDVKLVRYELRRKKIRLIEVPY